jgi:hypothetical protein
MDILQKTFNKAVDELSNSVSSVEELKRIADSLPDKIEQIIGQMPDEILSSIKAKSEKGLTERRTIHAEFVERNISRWKDGFDRLELLIEIATEAGESFNARLRPEATKQGDITFDVVVRLHAKGCLISKEILSLLKNGYADGAHARWRALHEVSVTAMFLAKHGVDAANNYIDYEFIEAYKGATQLNKYEGRLNAIGFNEEELANLKQQYERVLDKHGKEFGKPYGWAQPFLRKGKPTFFALEEDVGLDHWRPYYRWASQNVHASIKALRYSLGLSEATEDILQAGPSNSGMTDPAHSTAISLTNLTSTTLFLSPNIDGLVAAKILLALSDEVGDAFLRCDEKPYNNANAADAKNLAAD